MNGLETDRLRLRPFVEEDIDALHGVLSDPDVMEFSRRGPFKKEETAQLIRWCQESYQQNGFGLWALERIVHPRLIGFCGLSIQTVSGKEWVEVGYRLATEVWGQGFATEAARAAVDYGFHMLHLPEIVAIIEPANTRSIRVAEKLGMTPWEEGVYHDKQIVIYGTRSNS